MAGERTSANLADLLERILDKGIVIVGDIRVNLLDIELLTIKLRLLVASVDRAKEMGIDWWEHDPMLASRVAEDERRRELARERSEERARRELPDGRRGGREESDDDDEDRGRRAAAEDRSGGPDGKQEEPAKRRKERG